MAGFADVIAAADRLRGHVHETPILTSHSLDLLAGRPVVLKCENFQRSGSFKFRGAAHAVARLDPVLAVRGVVTHSSGNFAGALALAAALRGIPCHVVMPTHASAVKRQAVLDRGARVVPCPPTQADREATAAQVVSETGGMLIHSYDDPDVLAGQGTAALELLNASPGLAAVLAPIGGGGLCGGCSLVARHRHVAMWAAEPSGADDAARSLEAGRRLPQTAPDTIADGLRTGLGRWTWPLVRDHVAHIERVPDGATRRAQAFVADRLKIIIEPSSAVAVAALFGPLRDVAPGLPVGVIVSGGNVAVRFDA